MSTFWKRPIEGQKLAIRDLREACEEYSVYFTNQGFEVFLLKGTKEDVAAVAEKHDLRIVGERWEEFGESHVCVIELE